MGTAWVIREQIIRDEIASKPAKQVVLNLKVGQIPVTFDRDVLWMKQIAPTFGQTRSPAQVAPVLNLDESDFDTRLPIQDVSTGLPFLLIPLKTLDAIKRAHVNPSLLRQLVAPLDGKVIFLSSRETYHSDNQISKCCVSTRCVAQPSGKHWSGTKLQHCHYNPTNQIEICSKLSYPQTAEGLSRGCYSL